MKDIEVILQDSPGTLADLCELLAEGGINIEGISVTTYKGECPIHILVDDAEGARAILEANWMDVISVQDVLLTEIPDQVGALGKISRRLAENDINIEVVYLTITGDLAMVVDDLDKAQWLL